MGGTMIVIIEREPGSTRWEYPDNTNAFKRSVTVGQQLYANYVGSLDLAALSANVSYAVVEHTGLMPTQATKRHVGMSELGERLPDAVLVELKDMESDTGQVQGKREAASRVITRIHSNYPVDVFSAAFSALLGQLVTNTSLGSGQAATILDQLKYADL